MAFKYERTDKGEVTILADGSIQSLVNEIANLIHRIHGALNEQNPMAGGDLPGGNDRIACGVRFTRLETCGKIRRRYQYGISGAEARQAG